jgi:hypothetical protein
MILFLEIEVSLIVFLQKRNYDLVATNGSDTARDLTNGIYCYRVVTNISDSDRVFT